MKFVLKNKDIEVAVKKVANAMKDSIIFKPMLMGDRKIASLSASNGYVQVQTALSYEGEATNEKYVLAPTFKDVVLSIAAFTESDITVDIEENRAIVAADTVSVEVPLLTEGKEMEVKNPAEALCISVASEQLKNAVDCGGYAFTSGDGAVSSLKNAIIFKVTDTGLRVVTAAINGTVIAGALADIATKGERNEKNEVFSLNAQSFLRIVSGLKAETVQLFVFENQVILRDGNDFSIFTPNKKEFSAKILEFPFIEKPETYKFSVDAKRLIQAIDITSIGLGKKATRMELSGGKLKISGLASNVYVDVVEPEGEITFSVDGSILKGVVSHLAAETITLQGDSDVAPCFVSSSVASATTLLGLVDENYGKEEEEEVQDEDSSN